MRSELSTVNGLMTDILYREAVPQDRISPSVIDAVDIYHLCGAPPSSGVRISV
jgi:hypothetical protein